MSTYDSPSLCFIPSVHCEVVLELVTVLYPVKDSSGHHFEGSPYQDFFPSSRNLSYLFLPEHYLVRINMGSVQSVHAYIHTHSRRMGMGIFFCLVSNILEIQVRTIAQCTSYQRSCNTRQSDNFGSSFFFFLSVCLFMDKASFKATYQT